MEYLRGNAPASAPGLFVVCRYLSRADEGQSEPALRKALQVLRSPDAQSETAAVLKASLVVGAGVGVIIQDKATSTWIADPRLVREMATADDPWPWFQGELLHRMTQHALVELENKREAPDLILGLTWFLQISPLTPLQSKWGAGPEDMTSKIGLAALSSPEQWRSFQRWAIALGLARHSDHGGAKVLIPDASSAIAAQLPHLPDAGRARDWLAALQNRLPVLGSRPLLDQLPGVGQDWSSLPPSVALGLLKLERAGVLSLESSDDADDVLAVGLGGDTRQIGRITMGGSV